VGVKIPVTIVTGFLGSGKTTLVRHLLQNNRGLRIAVLVNEFGEVGIDGELLRSCRVCDEEDSNSNIVELANGCLCCTVQEEFLPVMQELLQRRDRLDCIAIETSGLALPKPLVQAFRWPEIRTGATVDGIVTVVDCWALAEGRLVADLNALNSQREADPNLEHETPLEELFADQLNCADLVLLTKMDLVDAPTREKILLWLQQRLPSGVKILPCANGEIAAEILLGFNAAVEDNLELRPSHHDNEEEHDHDDEIESIHLLSNSTFEPQQLVNRLSQLVREQEIYRIKGFVAVPEKRMRLVLQGVGNRFDYFYDRPWLPEETPQTSLIAIGRNLDRELIQATINP
jgi:cobalamin biosynthesis protein CobW